MTSKETRTYEMLQRVREFGKARANRFPDDTEGGQAFASVAAAVAQVAAYDDAKTRSSERGTDAKAAAREGLMDHLRTISRTARVIASKTPGFQDRFRIRTSKMADPAILSAGRVFADEAASVKDRFIAHGMADTFVADLNALVGAFDEAIAGLEGARQQKAVAQKGLRAALLSGVAATRALDVIVTNQLGHDADAINAWRHGRKVVRTRRASGAPDSVAEAPPAPAVIPASPPAPEAVATDALPRSA